MSGDSITLADWQVEALRDQLVDYRCVDDPVERALHAELLARTLARLLDNPDLEPRCDHGTWVGAWCRQCSLPDRRCSPGGAR